MSFTDQQLSAYLDGELPIEEAEALEAALKSDPALREALARLRSVDAVLSETLGEITDEGVPDHILAMVKAGDTETASDTASGNVVWMSAWKKGLSSLTMPVGLAAAMMVGWIFGGQVFTPEPRVPDGVVVAGEVDPGSALYAALESTPSGEARDGFSPTLSFVSGDGVCREVSSDTQRALACRDVSNWTVLVVSHDVSLGGAGGYVTASGQTSIIFDVLADQLMTGPPLSAEAEAERLANSWRASDPSDDG